MNGFLIIVKSVEITSLKCRGICWWSVSGSLTLVCHRQSFGHSAWAHAAVSQTQWTWLVQLFYATVPISKEFIRFVTTIDDRTVASRWSLLYCEVTDLMHSACWIYPQDKPGWWSACLLQRELRVFYVQQEIVESHGAEGRRFERRCLEMASRSHV